MSDQADKHIDSARTKADNVIIRPATVADMPRKAEIAAWYVLNTRRFTTTPQSVGSTIRGFHALQAAGYPFLVAEIDGLMVGHARLCDFRSPTGGYAQTTELAVYVDHQFLYRGIGTALVKKLFDVIEHPEKYDNTWLGVARRGEGSIVNVVASMTVKPDGRDGGEGLATFYESLGFERVGRMKKIGKSQGEW